MAKGKLQVTIKAVPRSGRTRAFVAYWYFVGWDCLAIGASFCWSQPNIEVHLPFGFIKFGWCRFTPGIEIMGLRGCKRTFGYDGRF